MSVSRTFQLPNRELTVSLNRRRGKPALAVVLETDDNRSWSGPCPDTPKLTQVCKGIHELERQGQMIRYRAKDLQAIRNWISEIAHGNGHLEESKQHG